MIVLDRDCFLPLHYPCTAVVMGIYKATTSVCCDLNTPLSIKCSSAISVHMGQHI